MPRDVVTSLPGESVAPFPEAAAPARPTRSHLAIVPGMLLCAALTVAAFAARRIPGVATLSPMIIAIIFGMVFHNVIGTPARARPGVTFSMKRVLRFAIILLGLQLTFTQVAEVGLTGVMVIAATLVSTFLITKWFGRVIGVERKLAELIAAGTSICGASAVIATNTVTEAHDEDVAYAVACVTVFGSISMFAYPLLPALLHLDPHAYGLWTGASIHEIAQVVAAAFQDGKDAGEFGTIAKLSRVLMLAPLVIALSLFNARRQGAHAHGKDRKPIALPWFVAGFVALVLVNSVVTIAPEAKSWIVQITTFLLSLSLAAMGLETDVRKLKAKGWRPMLLGAFAWLFVSGFSLLLVEMTR
ncbi:YeiH family protein [Telmatospirillum sp.]|uniref:YeiH family protein n=1 Tax=Telmatospirillum sp. TaxID=2079197 RepID=UPI00284BC98A|nr:YeiH family protein [Telmatospirillum sp.]MDR3439203.1 YeiH family protein [Telmatospirillum sp.]